MTQPAAYPPRLIAGGTVVTGGGGDATLASSFGPILEFVHDSGGTYHLTLKSPGIPSHAAHAGFCVASAAVAGNIATATVTSATNVNFRTQLHDGTNSDVAFSFLIYATERTGALT